MNVRIRLIRHATLIVEYGGHRFIVDPMLDDQGVRPAIQNAPNPRNNPLVPLPIAAEEVVHGVEAVLVTHTHSDHWDGTAARLLPKATPLFGQIEDEAKFRGQGFTNVESVTSSMPWNGIEITRTDGQHGRGEIGKAMAPVSGFLLSVASEPTVYIAGDTIWCDEVQLAIREHNPAIIVVNAGAAQFLEGGPITMSADDVIATAEASKIARLIAVHIESINHCLLTRADLAFQLDAARVRDRVAIPQDGEWVDIDG